MYIARIPNRNSRPTYLIRHARRVGNKIVKTTVLNITALPDHAIEGLRILLRGGIAVDDPKISPSRRPFASVKARRMAMWPLCLAPCAHWACPR